jgi:hypothetical protein
MFHREIERFPTTTEQLEGARIFPDACVSVCGGPVVTVRMLQDASRESPSRSVVFPLRTVSSCGIGELGEAKATAGTARFSTTFAFSSLSRTDALQKNVFFLGEIHRSLELDKAASKGVCAAIQKSLVFSGLGLRLTR